ncbi:hypothetical protein LCGC14_1103240 [marine sediment metagenome]|uniref:Uncharacterized protein n=1 Tax=marine sediment metagenome TaxID=412755 RepID=A0A0F9QF54_9ZZZZ
MAIFSINGRKLTIVSKHISYTKYKIYVYNITKMNINLLINKKLVLFHDGIMFKCEVDCTIPLVHVTTNDKIEYIQLSIIEKAQLFR